MSEFVWKRIFFLRFGLLSKRTRWNQSTKKHLFKNAFQSGDFENAGFLRLSRRTKTEVFEYDVIHHHDTFLNKACYRISIALAFSCGRAKTIQIRYVWTPFFFEQRKKSPFSKISGYVLTGPNSSITFGIVSYAFVPLFNERSFWNWSAVCI